MEAATLNVQDLFVALGHPLRRRILREMNGGPPASPREVSELVDDTLSNVSYHFRVLAKSGVLELVRTRPVRGSTQHFYGVSIDAEWAQAVLEIDEPS
ncbi:MAG TPA: helix-turn-helix domain-containing protein [Solirubrobacterales bacterium]